MRVEQLNQEGWAKTYLLSVEDSNEICLIDPVFDFTDLYLELIKKRGVVLKYCISTHTHADHITGCFTLKDKTDCQYVMWNSTASLGVTTYVDESSTLELAGKEISFHHAPGHTEDSMLVLFGNHLMTGDFIFTGIGGVGRDDLPSGRIDIHWDSLEVLKRFSGETLVYTGHDPPGTEMMTLEWNRAHNPILNMSSLKEYQSWQNETVKQLGYVSKIKVALPANLFGEIPEDIPWLN